MQPIELTKFHDALLKKIELKENATELLFQLATKETVRISLIETERLRCDEFREGNIVLEVSIISDSATGEQLLGGLLQQPTASTKSHSAYIEKIKIKIDNGDLVLLHISPSYGCELIALCKEIEISNEDKLKG